MAQSERVEGTPNQQRAAIEFHYDAEEPLSLSELADSFRAIDNLYSVSAKGSERLAVVELRSGSIFAVFAPFISMLGHGFEAISTANELIGFAKDLKQGLDLLSKSETANEKTTGDPQIAAELAEIVRPLQGRGAASFGVTGFRYRSHTAERTVEVEATYNQSEINRVLTGASLTSQSDSAFEAQQSIQQSLLKKVKLSLRQANAGPAKAKGRTGDRGILESVSSEELPVYFADSTHDLKGKMVGGQRNPLKGAYLVDVMVTREAGVPKFYTMIEVHAVAKVAKAKDLPLLEANQSPPKKRSQ